MQNWVRIPILISLDRMVEDLGNDNLTKVIMEAFMLGGGFPIYQIAQKSYVLGLMVSMYFKAPRMVVQSKLGTIMHLIP
jgi:hypothetical protein